MAVEIKHIFVSAKGDGPDDSLVQPGDWNALHVFKMTGVNLLGRPSSGAGSAEEIPLGVGLAIEDGALVNTARAFPIGTITCLAGNYNPSGWFLCDGRLVSETTYADLFYRLAYAFGGSSASGTFGIPDMRGRVPAGRDNMGGTSANRLTSLSIPGGATSLGSSKVGGGERVTLTVGQIPSHDHSLDSASSSHTHFIAIEGNQNDTSPAISSDESLVTANTAGTSNQQYRLDGSTATPNVGKTSSSGGSHTHSMDNTGGGGDHNNIQPTIVMNFMIFHGVYD